MKRTIIFTGGGTGGHVFPGLAVIKELQKTWDGDILWIGSKKGSERRFVEEAGIPFIGIPCGKFRRYFSLKNFIDIFRVFAGILVSARLIARLRPVLLFSKGGFVSVPPTISAGRKGVPVVIHESDSDPGLATKINSRYASKIILSFERTRKYFKEDFQAKMIVLGNPVRSEIKTGDAAAGKKMLQIPAGKKVILILGGSQGALQINTLIAECIEKLTEKYFIVHQMGPVLYQPSDRDLYRTFDFIGQELPHFLAAADIVVSRAGANTLSELAATAKPSILIPLRSGAGRGDQVKNARLFADAGASVVLEGDDAVPENLIAHIDSILGDGKRLDSMKKNVAALMNPEAAEEIASLLLDLTEER